MDIVADSKHLGQNVDMMTSHFVRTLPQVAAICRDSTSGFRAKRDVIKKPPRRNRPRTRQDVNGSSLRSDDATSKPRRDRIGIDNNEEDKENSCGGVSRNQSRCGGRQAHRPAASPSMSPRRSPTSELIYQQCLGSVIASYLSPLRCPTAATRLRHDPRRFFDTLTSPGNKTPVARRPRDDHSEVDDDSNVNTSVWLSDTALPDAETSSGVETATPSPPPEVLLGDDVTQQVRKSVPLCDVSRISAVSSVPREQLSSLGDAKLPGVDGAPSSAFHSTFNYPLHSTLRGTGGRCPSPLPESPTSPVRRDWSDGRRPRQHRSRDLPACRRCCDATPLRRQRARARLDRQQPPVHDDDDDFDAPSASNISLHATRGSLPDLSDLSAADSERMVERDRRRRCGPSPAMVDVNVVRRGARTSCTRCRHHGLHIRPPADPLMIFDYRRNEPVQLAWSRNPTSVIRPAHSGSAATVSARRPTTCFPNIRNHGNDAAPVVTETRRRSHLRGADLACGHKRVLSKKLKLINNILCSARTADVTQLTTLGHV